MARPVEYDRNKVVNAALQLFWRDGYEATTIEKLLEVMELNRGSFYAAFGDKEGLFIEVLDCYMDQVLSVSEKTIQAKNHPLEAIYSFFEYFILLNDKEIRERGCLIFSTVSELCHTKPELASIAWRKGNILKNIFIEKLQRAQERKIIRADKSAYDMADHLITLAAGLRMHCKMKTEPTAMKNILNMGMAALS